MNNNSNGSPGAGQATAPADPHNHGDPLLDGRRLAIVTELDDDDQPLFLLERIEGTEAISELYCYHLDLVVSENDVDKVKPEDFIGTKVTISIDAVRPTAQESDDSEFGISEDGRHDRHLHGYVRRLIYLRKDDRWCYYRAEVVPWLWFLSLRTNSRVFQGAKVDQIVTTIFDESQITGTFEFNLKRHTSVGDTPADQSSDSSDPEYHVQYQESDFAFISRLLEDEGCLYYFVHDETDCRLIITDHIEGYETETVGPVAPVGSASEHPTELGEWRHSFEYTTGQVALNDYDFRAPGSNLNQMQTARCGTISSTGMEHYEYPGGYNNVAVSLTEDNEDSAGAIARRRIEELNARCEHIAGTSVSRWFAPGSVFSVDGSDAGYLIHSVRFTAHAEGSHMTQANPIVEDDVYWNEFTCIPSGVRYRPPRRTSRPRIAGAQTATVVGPEQDSAGDNGEVYTDQYGRVRVKFHWDRRPGRPEADSSCWVRVGQVWAGPRWGGMFIPHVGNEVIVEFLEGDPDKPLITGSVYNERNMPRHPLDEEHRSKHKFVGVLGDTVGNEIEWDEKFKPKNDSDDDELGCLLLKSRQGSSLRLHEDIHFETDGKEYKLTGKSTSGASWGEVYSSVKNNILDSEMSFGLFKSSVDIGIKTSLELGGSLDVKGGYSIGIHRGDSFEHNTSKNFVLSGADDIELAEGGWKRIVNDTAMIQAGQGFKLAGGSMNNSIVEGTQGALTLAFGMQADAPQKFTIPIVELTQKLNATYLAGIAGASVGMTSVAATTTQLRQYMDSRRENFDVAEAAEEHGSADKSLEMIGDFATVISGVLTTALLAKFKLLTKSYTAPSYDTAKHDGPPDSQIVLDSDRVHLSTDKASINITKQGNIDLNVQGDINFNKDLKCSGSVMRIKYKINHQNLQVQ
jgi:type VI secretion system secreted protein VgrG